MNLCREMVRRAYLGHKHGPWRNLHVMTQLKILQKGQSLAHADVTIYLEAHICNRPSRVQVAHDVLCDYVQAWSLHTTKEAVVLSLRS